MVNKQGKGQGGQKNTIKDQKNEENLDDLIAGLKN